MIGVLLRYYLFLLRLHISLLIVNEVGLLLNLAVRIKGAVHEVVSFIFVGFEFLDDLFVVSLYSFWVDGLGLFFHDQFGLLA